MPPLEKEINRFAREYLSYSDPKRHDSKFFHDPLWGTIEVKGYETAILDTPLLQRLRQIHQTGAVYQTFSSAHHTRFDHTIGVMHLAGRMAETLGRKYTNLIDEKSIQKVRLAALLHDTGHSAFSHTSEEYYALCDDIKAFRKKNERFANSGSGEILSHLIAASAAFKAYFAKLKKLYPEILVEVDDFASLILGKPTDPEKLFEAEIISGPFDADKLDYFPRDGRAAGVQLALDFERLLHCMELAKIEDAKENETWSLIVHRGGFNPIQQLLFARASLFATVYHHHKVRACDSMVKGCFEFFQKKGKKFKKSKAFPGVELDQASSFLYLTDFDFFAEASNHDRESFEHRLIHSLLYRRLFKRILTVSTRTIDGFNVEEGESEQKIAYLDFLKLRKDKEGLRKLSAKILNCAGVPISVHEVWLDLPTAPSLDKAGKARIRVGDKGEQDNLVKLSAFIPVKQWVETYNQYYSQSFLFGPDSIEHRAKLAKAALEVLEKDHGLRLLKSAVAKDIRKYVFNSTNTTGNHKAA